MMEVRRFRLSELDQITMAAVEARVSGLQPHRITLGELGWLRIEEALWPLGAVRPPKLAVRIGLGPKSLRR
jgi:hypothetical protein